MRCAFSYPNIGGPKSGGHPHRAASFPKSAGLSVRVFRDRPRSRSRENAAETRPRSDRISLRWRDGARLGGASPADHDDNPKMEPLMSKRLALLAAAAVLALTAGAVAPVSSAMAEKTVTVGGAPMYPSKNIIQNAVNSKDHTTLVAAVKAAG